MPFKTTFLPLTASLAFHALVATSFYFPALQNDDRQNRPVEISYLQAAEMSVSVPPQIKYPPVAKALSKPKEVIVTASETDRARAARLKTQAEKPESTRSAMVNSFSVKNSEEFLADPQKGRVFLDYFGRVKQRVRRAIENTYSRGQAGRGDVTLMFVLKADGTVVKVYPVNESSSADEFLKDLATRCVRDCSPFPRFPKELGMDRISFNLSILFDET